MKKVGLTKRVTHTRSCTCHAGTERMNEWKCLCTTSAADILCVWVLSACSFCFTSLFPTKSVGLEFLRCVLVFTGLGLSNSSNSSMKKTEECRTPLAKLDRMNIVLQFSTVQSVSHSSMTDVKIIILITGKSSSGCARTAVDTQLRRIVCLLPCVTYFNKERARWRETLHLCTPCLLYTSPSPRD